MALTGTRISHSREHAVEDEYRTYLLALHETLQDSRLEKLAPDAARREIDHLCQYALGLTWAMALLERRGTLGTWQARHAALAQLRWAVNEDRQADAAAYLRALRLAA